MHETRWYAMEVAGLERLSAFSQEFSG